MSGMAYFVCDPATVARRDDGVWIEVPCGSEWIQMYLTRHAARMLSEEIRLTLNSNESTVIRVPRHG